MGKCRECGSAFGGSTSSQTIGGDKDDGDGAGDVIGAEGRDETMPSPPHPYFFFSFVFDSCKLLSFRGS